LTWLTKTTSNRAELSTLLRRHERCLFCFKKDNQFICEECSDNIDRFDQQSVGLAEFAKYPVKNRDEYFKSIDNRSVLEAFGPEDVLPVLKESILEKAKEHRSFIYKLERRVERNKKNMDDISYEIYCDFIKKIKKDNKLFKVLMSLKRSIFLAERLSFTEILEEEKRFNKIDFDKISQIPVRTIVEHYGGIFKRSGSQLVSRCPFPDHMEKTPSFFINEKKNVFSCWGCGRMSNNVGFVAAIENCDNISACKILNKFI
jgi:hypothetical protein